MGSFQGRRTVLVTIKTAATLDGNYGVPSGESWIRPFSRREPLAQDANDAVMVNRHRVRRRPPLTVRDNVGPCSGWTFLRMSPRHAWQGGDDSFTP